MESAKSMGLGEDARARILDRIKEFPKLKVWAESVDRFPDKKLAEENLRAYGLGIALHTCRSLHLCRERAWSSHSMERAPEPNRQTNEDAFAPIERAIEAWRSIIYIHMYIFPNDTVKELELRYYPYLVVCRMVRSASASYHFA